MSLAQKYEHGGQKRLKNSAEEENIETKDKNEINVEDKKVTKNIIKGMLRFFATNLGMIFLVLIYVVAGAFLFQLLEQHEEIQTCQLNEGKSLSMISSYRSELFNYIRFNTTTDIFDETKDGPSIYHPKLNEIILKLRDDILDLRNKKYYGQNCEEESLWQFQSCLLFTMSIVAAIGYGHVAPSTWEGQIVCICYATIGIPLFLMSVANISGILGDCFRFVYSRICCFLCMRNDKMKKNIKAEEPEKANKSPNFNDDFKESNVVDDEAEEEPESSKKVVVPLIVVVFTIITYIVFGGFLFSMTEDWDIIQGSYFSYISLATIGFGDLVPGINQLLVGDKSTGGKNLLIAFIYIFIGMAILAMCFDLMQHELVEKFVFIAKKLGLAEKDKEELIHEQEKELEKQKQKEAIQKFKEEKPKVNLYNHDEEIVKKAFELPNLSKQKTSIYQTDVRFSASLNSDHRQSKIPKADRNSASESIKQIIIKPAKIYKDPTVISFEGPTDMD